MHERDVFHEQVNFDTHHIYPLDDHTVFLTEHLQHRALLALLWPTDNLHLIALENLPSVW